MSDAPREVEPEALETAAVEAFLIGDDETSTAAWEQAHTRFGADGRPADAARCAFWAGLAHLLRGEQGPAGGWLARAHRCAEEAGADCPTAALLLVPDFLQTLGAGDANAASAIADRIVDAGRRTDDHDVVGFGLLCCGEALVALGHLDEGMRHLDEAMVGVTAGELTPIAAGIVYCAVIETCVDSFDLRRAAEWTDALDRWCASRPGLVPFRGQCLVHRSQVLQARGAWSDAVEEADRAYERLAAAAHPAVGTALYQLGEMHRLRGDFARAEAAYRRADQHGRNPEPGLALLRLAEGDVAGAVAAVERALLLTRGQRNRFAALSAAVEILLGADRVAEAEQALAELLLLAEGDPPSPVRAIVRYAEASVALATRDHDRAIRGFRDAWDIWLALGIPYEAARCREQLGLTLQQLGDVEGADNELAAALADYRALGAALDVDRVQVALTSSSALPDGLSPREVEVLRVVATGATNREVADALSISEHTVARHLQNIYAKLGLSSRAAATSYVHGHGLV